MVRPGVQLAGYVLRNEVGRGPFGTSWLADAGGTHVRLKILNRDFAARPEGSGAIHRLAAAVQVHQALHHDHLVRAFGLLSAPDRGAYGVASEWTEGFSISELQVTDAAKDAEDPTELARLLFLFEELGDALGWLHARGLVHGNLKPTNVLVQRGDFGPVPKLLDLTWSAIGVAALPGSVISPEQYAGQVPGAASDQWAFGALMTGRLMRSDGRLGRLPGALADALSRMNAPHPGERFPSMKEAVAELRAVRSGLERARILRTGRARPEDSRVAAPPVPEARRMQHPGPLRGAGTALFGSEMGPALEGVPEAPAPEPVRAHAERSRGEADRAAATDAASDPLDPFLAERPTQPIGPAVRKAAAAGAAPNAGAPEQAPEPAPEPAPLDLAPAPGPGQTAETLEAPILQAPSFGPLTAALKRRVGHPDREADGSREALDVDSPEAETGRAARRLAPAALAEGDLQVSPEGRLPHDSQAVIQLRPKTPVRVLGTAAAVLILALGAWWMFGQDGAPPAANGRPSPPLEEAMPTAPRTTEADGRKPNGPEGPPAGDGQAAEASPSSKASSKMPRLRADADRAATGPSPEGAASPGSSEATTVERKPEAPEGKLACLDGKLQGCVRWGDWATDAGRVRDARSAFHRACRGGSAYGCIEAMRWWSGSGAPGAEAKALAYLEAGCRLDDAPACHHAARYHRTGVAGDIDRERARQLQTKACALGRLDSCRNGRASNRPDMLANQTSAADD